jgi:hypothetical protein
LAITRLVLFLKRSFNMCGGGGIGGLIQGAVDTVSNIVSNPIVDTVAAGVLTDGASLVDSAPAFLPEAASDGGAVLGADGLWTATDTSLGLSGAADLSSLAKGVGNVASGVFGLSNAGSTASKAAAAADPFASQRAQYQKQLSDFMANPSSMFTTPGYDSGLQAVERTNAANGFLGGGKAATDIANYSGNFYNQQIATVSNLAGANIGSPGTAGTVTQQGGNNQQSSLNTLINGATLVGNAFTGHGGGNGGGDG